MSCCISIFRNFLEPFFKHKMWYLMVSKKRIYDSCRDGIEKYVPRVCLFDLILYIPSTIFQLNRDVSSWVEPVLS